MFIKPFDCTSTNEPSAWVEHAANTYLRVQSKVTGYSLFKSILGSSASPVSKQNDSEKTNIEQSQNGSLSSSTPKQMTRRATISTSAAISPNLQNIERKKSILNYKYRIILTLSEQTHIVAVEDSLSGIMQDWAWLESNLTPKVSNHLTYT
jgi:hypothetical protein